MNGYPKWKRYVGALKLTIEEQYECWRRMGFPTYFKIRALHLIIVCSTSDPSISSDYPKANIYRTYRNFFGPQAILFQEGKKGLEQRTLLNRGFHSVSRYTEEMVQVAERLRDRLLKAGSMDTELGILLPRATMETVAKTGFNMDLRDPKHDADVRALKLMMQLPGSRLMLLPYVGQWFLEGYYSSVMQRVHALIDATVETRLKETRREAEDLLDVILHSSALLFGEESGSSQPSQEWIRDQIKIMSVGGTDTTSITLRWALLLLARYPDIQTRLKQEIRQAEKEGCHIVERLVYMDAFLKETLRMYGPVSGPLRKPVANPVFGYEISDEAFPYVNIMYNASLAHPDESRFSNATEFYPDRWLDAKPSIAFYAPFGIGARNCIGKRFAMLEMKLFLWILLRGTTQVIAVDPLIEFPVQAYDGTMYGPASSYPIRVTLCESQPV